LIRSTQAFRDDETIIPTPPIQDEDLWWQPPAMIAAGYYLPLPYLPDVEEIPAGSLIGLVPDGVQGSGTVSIVYGKGTIGEASGGGKISGITGGGRID